MDAQKLIQMANQIGDFFDAMPDHEEALTGIANHLQRFWEPRMRRQLLASLDQGNAADLNPVVVSAIRAHRDKLLPHEKA
jgi:formate dehydrogenase subunit delta